MCRQVLIGLFLLLSNICTYGQTLPDLIPFTDGYKWGYADTNGRVVISPQWDDAGFFKGSRAEVLLLSKNPYPFIHCIIDRQGRYIVTPEAGWNGIWKGWARTGLNAIDSAGHMGLIDTAGQVLIPYEWEGGGSIGDFYEPVQDSYKVVYRSGKSGIVDRQGRIVVPAEWKRISLSSGNGRIGMFMVSGRADWTEANAFGLIDRHNRLVVQQRYRAIYPLWLPDGKIHLHLVRQVTDTLPSGMIVTRDAEQVMELSGGILIPLHPAPKDSPYLIPVAHGYFLFQNATGKSYGLMDASRRVVLPSDVWRVTNDSIIQRRKEVIGKDSLLLTLTYWSTIDLKRLDKPRTWLIYQRTDQMAIPDAGSRHLPRYELPQRIDGFQRDGPTRFYRDSLLYTVEGMATDRQGRGLFLLNGNLYTGDPGRRTMRVYGAIVDSDFHYILGPVTDYRIADWDPFTGIAVADGFSQRYRENGYTLLDRRGRELIRPQNELSVEGGFRWRGQVYAKVAEKEAVYDRFGRPEYWQTTRIKVVDSGWAPLPALSKYQVNLPFNPAYQTILQRLPEGAIPVSDSAGRPGFVLPDGALLLPKLSFRYEALQDLFGKWFLVRQDSATFSITDEVAKPVMQIPGLVSVQSSWRNIRIAEGLYGVENIPVPSRLVWVTAKRNDGTTYSFYVDDHGRSYYKE